MSLSHQPSFVTKNHSRLLRVTRSHPCPVCRHSSWCSYWEDGRGAVCMRRQSDRPARNGQGWLHFFDDASSIPTRPPLTRLRPQPVVADRADVERRHVVYTALLSALTLWPEHQQELMRRGLSPEEIERLQYVSAPAEAEAYNVTRSLSLRYDLCGVAGFYQLQHTWRMVRTGPGFFVPYRNERGLIEGLQLRRFPYAGKDKYLWFSSKDKPSGSSSGSPVHFARAAMLASAEEVVITEGALKADVTAYFLNSTVIAAAGVSNFGRDFAARLRSIAPAMRTVYVAFDLDWQSNETVKRALFRLTEELERARLAVLLRAWPRGLGKGIDDYLLSVSKGRAA
ncbi:MAG TPA: DUF3854 domain-containing protein [Pyrinomonadaceae bacterium]|nr:DUF3854 domain-containing protein [Pyrinomonadaceae bacterium]